MELRSGKICMNTESSWREINPQCAFSLETKYAKHVRFHGTVLPILHLYIDSTNIVIKTKIGEFEFVNLWPNQLVAFRTARYNDEPRWLWTFVPENGWISWSELVDLLTTPRSVPIPESLLTSITSDEQGSMVLVGNKLEVKVDGRYIRFCALSTQRIAAWMDDHDDTEFYYDLPDTFIDTMLA